MDTLHGIRTSPTPTPATDPPRRITAMSRAVAPQGLSTHNSGGNYELSGGRVSPKGFLRDRQKEERIKAEQWITRAGSPSSAVWMCISKYNPGEASASFIHTAKTCLGTRKRCGSAHPGLATLAAGSNVPASALDLDLVLKRLFCSSSKDTSPLKA